jgi:hypothetical protein
MVSEDVQGLFQLLMADTWMKKCEVAQQRLAYLPFIRKTLEHEAGLAIQRGARDDAHIFAAHISLLNDIEEYGIAVVQAEIMRTLRCRDYAGR